MSHPSAERFNPEIVRRLNRALGQLRTIVAMIETHRSCKDVAMQLQAVEKAVAQAKKAFIHEHIDHSFEAGKPASKEALKTLREIAKYL